MKRILVILGWMAIAVGSVQAGAPITCDLFPSNGPAVGGNTLVITNCSQLIGNGTDITNLVFGSRIGFRAFLPYVTTTNILGQGTNWVKVVVPACMAGRAAIYVQSASMGQSWLHEAYTFNPAGVIGLEAGEYWFGLAGGLNNDVCALKADTNGAVYFAGSFTEANNTDGSTNYANYVAQWDGANWTTLAGGLNNTARALALGSNGTVYAGGDFDEAYNADGSTNRAKYVAQWDGASWTNLAGGLSGSASALAVGPDGALYVGGNIWEAYNADGTTNLVHNIAKWNGTSWTNLAGGLNNSVYALAVGPDGTLYVGGNFGQAYNADGTTNIVQNIAKWNGTSWTNLGLGMDNCVNALAVGTNGILYAGGYFANAGGVAVNYVAQWNGTSWSGLGVGMDNYVNALAVGTSGMVYAGGDFTNAGGVAAISVAQWNPATAGWTNLAGGMSAWSTVSALALDPNGALYAGGSFNTAGGVAARRAAKWMAVPGYFGVAPVTSPLAGGVAVTISGMNLCNGDLSDVTSVTLCEVPAAVQSVAGSTQIVVIAGPAAVGGLGQVLVYSTGYGITTKSNAFSYLGTNIPPPGGVSATYGTYTNMVRVTWNGVAGAISYDLLRNTTPDVNGATFLHNEPAENALRLDALNGQSGQRRTKNEEQGTAVYYYDDFTVVARQSYYYWVRAYSVSNASVLGYVGMGYAELGNGQTVGRADLTASDLVFLPVNLTNGSPAETVSYRLANGGPDALTAASVRFDFYMLQGEQAVWMAYHETNVTLAVGAERLYILDASARQWLLVRGDLAGQYTVQARARHLDLMSAEQTGSNTTTAPGAVLVRAAGVNSPGRSVNDYDGDGKSDVALCRADKGVWLAILSGTRGYGTTGIEPALGGGRYWTAAGDYDGDGRLDYGLYEENGGTLWILKSSDGQVLEGQLGGPGLRPVSADYDGDRKTDPAVYGPALGYWEILKSGSAYAPAVTRTGGPGYEPVAADYDGDGLADPMAYREADGHWAGLHSSQNYAAVEGYFGGDGFRAGAADFDGDGLADPVVYREADGLWQIMLSTEPGMVTIFQLGEPGYVATLGDFDGDGRADPGVYIEQGGAWYGWLSGHDYEWSSARFGGPGYQPVSE